MLLFFLVVLFTSCVSFLFCQPAEWHLGYYFHVFDREVLVSGTDLGQHCCSQGKKVLKMWKQTGHQISVMFFAMAPHHRVHTYGP